VLMLSIRVDGPHVHDLLLRFTHATKNHADH
jgi:hypothetical protein